MAVNFTNSGSYSSTAGLPTGGTYTVLLWYRLNADTNSWQEFWRTAPSHYVETAANGTDFVFSGGSGNVGTFASSLDVWYCAAVTVNGTSATVYHGTDPFSLSSASGSCTNLTAPTNVVLGNGVDGRIANVKVYNAVLTAAEVALELATHTPQRLTDLLRWHPLVGDIIDYSGNGADFTTGSGGTVADGPPIAWRAVDPHIAGAANTPKASTDTAAGTDASSVAASAASADSATGADATAIQRASTSTDSATGADATAIQRASTSTDSATGADALFVTAIDHKESTDSATGTESIYVDIPELKAGTDAATGADVSTIAATAASTDAGAGADATAIQRTSGSTDSATSTDTTAIQRASTSTDAATGTEQTTVLLRVTTSTDTAAGTEAIAILRISTSTDTAAGTEDTDSGPFIIDTAVGTEDISIVEIAFTQVLPLVRRTTYDLVVVAMIPNAAGAPSFLEIDPLEWSSLRWANTLSRPQELSATCLLASVPDSVLDRLEKLDVLPTELWLYRDGRKVFAGPLLAWQTRGEQLQVEARGLLSYLQSMVVDSDLKYSAIDQHLIAKGLVDHYQALPYGHLGIDTAAVTPSGVLRDMEYVAAEQHQISRRVEELGALANGFDAEVDPSSRALQLWTPQKGADRSTGEDAIILDSRNITTADLMCSVAPDDLASESYATASVSGLDEPLVSKLGNAELRARIGRRSVLRSFSNASTQAELDAANQAVLDARARALIVPGPSIRVTPDADLSAYGVGDTVGFDLRAPLRLNGAFRIRKQQVTVSADGGDEAVDLEFV